MGTSQCQKTYPTAFPLTSHTKDTALQLPRVANSPKAFPDPTNSGPHNFYHYWASHMNMLQGSGISLMDVSPSARTLASEVLRSMRLLRSDLYLHRHSRRETEAVLEELRVAQLLICAVVQQPHRPVCEIQRLPEILQGSASSQM